jgi:hypothetical protein
MLNQMLWFVMIPLKEDVSKTDVHKFVVTDYTLDAYWGRIFRVTDNVKYLLVNGEIEYTRLYNNTELCSIQTCIGGYTALTNTINM